MAEDVFYRRSIDETKGENLSKCKSFFEDDVQEDSRAKQGHYGGQEDLR